MSKLLSGIFVFAALALVAEDADARRFGGGRNIGQQRSAINQQQAAPKAPAQQPQQAAPANATQQPAAGSKWLGPLAGLALGAGLFALFLNNGWAGVLAGLLMIGLIIAAALFAARALRSRIAAAPIQYAGVAAGGARAPTYGAAGVQRAAAQYFPPDFDAEQFVRHARLNFVRMQDAHDRGDLSGIRDSLTPELYREIEAETRAAGIAGQKTEVVTLKAEVLEVTTEADQYLVSVRFSGLIRERAEGAPEPFNEIWHLKKPVSGRSGWLVAGIQQDSQA